MLWNDATRKRMYVWRHNSYRGHVAMMKKQLHAMILSPSTTKKTKQQASKLLSCMNQLDESLKKRVDPL